MVDCPWSPSQLQECCTKYICSCWSATFSKSRARLYRTSAVKQQPCSTIVQQDAGIKREYVIRTRWPIRQSLHLSEQIIALKSLSPLSLQCSTNSIQDRHALDSEVLARNRRAFSTCKFSNLLVLVEASHVEKVFNRVEKAKWNRLPKENYLSGQCLENCKVILDMCGFLMNTLTLVLAIWNCVVLACFLYASFFHSGAQSRLPRLQNLCGLSWSWLATCAPGPFGISVFPESTIPDWQSSHRALDNVSGWGYLPFYRKLPLVGLEVHLPVLHDSNLHFLSCFHVSSAENLGETNFFTPSTQCGP